MMHTNIYKTSPKFVRRGILFIVSILPMASSTVAQIYSECCGKSSCLGFGRGSNCVTSGGSNCDLLISYQPYSSNPALAIHFKLVGRKPSPPLNSYVAMGISVGPQMGDDLVVACKSMGTSMEANMSYNNALRDNRNFAVQGSFFQQIAAYEDNGYLVCEFSIENGIVIPSGQDFYVVSNNKYHLLGAMGQLSGSSKIRKHDYDQSWASDHPISFKEIRKCSFVTSLKFFRDRFVLFHMIFMVFAFVSFIPTGMLIGRFLKESLPATRCWRLRVWQILHFSSLGFGNFLVVVGVILPVIVFGIYTQTSGEVIAHYSIGTIVISLVECNSIFGVAIICCGIRNRGMWKNLMSFTHWLLGVLAYSLGMIQLFLVPHFMRLYIGEHCTSPSAVVIMWVIFHIVVYLILSILLYYREKSLLDEPEPASTTVEPESSNVGYSRKEPESSNVGYSRKEPGKALLYDDYFDDRENNKRLDEKYRKPGSSSHGEKGLENKKDQPGAPLKPKPTFATFYDDFINPPDNIVRQGKGTSAKPAPRYVNSDKDLDGIDHFTDAKSRDMRRTSTYYFGKIEPRRAFIQFPLQIRIGLPNSNSLENEMIIATFFGLSLITSSVLCYLLMQKSGMRGLCNIERTQTSLWFDRQW